MGEYRCGLAVSVTEVFDITDNVGGCAGTTEHRAFVHPQLPAPQSSGPSQLMVHRAFSHAGFTACLTQLVGWQHCAGTQSVSVVQACASTGTVVTVVAGGIAVVTSATGGGVFCVQPARKTAAMQRRRSIIVFLSILKIGCNCYKPDGDYEKICTIRFDKEKVLRCFMRARQVTKYLFVMSPRLRASLQAQRGKEVLTFQSLKPPHKEAPSGAGVFIVFGGTGASATIFVIYPIHVLPIQNSDEPVKRHILKSRPDKNS